MKNNSIISTHLHLLHNFCRAKLNSVKQKQDVSKTLIQVEAGLEIRTRFRRQLFFNFNQLHVNQLHEFVVKLTTFYFLKYKPTMLFTVACINGFYILNLNFEYDWIYIYIYIYIVDFLVLPFNIYIYVYILACRTRKSMFSTHVHNNNDNNNVLLIHLRYKELQWIYILRILKFEHIHIYIYIYKHNSLKFSTVSRMLSKVLD